MRGSGRAGHDRITRAHSSGSSHSSRKSSIPTLPFAGLCCIIPARDEGLAPRRYQRQSILTVCGIPSPVIRLSTMHLMAASTC